MIRKLAVIRPKATGNPKWDKIFGQIRHVLGILFTMLMSFGLLNRLGLDISPESWSVFWGDAEKIIDAVFIAWGLIGQVVVQVSSWYSKGAA